MKKRIWSTLLVALLICALAVPATVALASQETYKFTWAELNPAEHLMTYSAQRFAEKLSELTGGRMTVEIYPAMQLGDEKSTYQSVQMGAVDFFRGNAISMGDFGAKKMALLALPFIFRDRPHLWQVLGGEVGDEILADVEQNTKDMLAIGWFEEGARHFFFTQKDVKSLADMKGLKIRVPQNQLSMDIVTAYGASPTPISYAELYTSLQTGVIDGAENPAVGYWSNSFWEVCKHFTYGGYSFTPCPVIMGTKTWAKLDDEDKAFVMQAMDFAEQWNKENSELNEKKALDQAVANGVVVSNVDVQEFIDASKPIYEQYGQGFEDLIAKIQAVK